MDEEEDLRARGGATGATGLVGVVAEEPSSPRSGLPHSRSTAFRALSSCDGWRRCDSSVGIGMAEASPGITVVGNAYAMGRTAAAVGVNCVRLRVVPRNRRLRFGRFGRSERGDGVSHVGKEPKGGRKELTATNDG